MRDVMLSKIACLLLVALFLYGQFDIFHISIAGRYSSLLSLLVTFVVYRLELPGKQQTATDALFLSFVFQFLQQMLYCSKDGSFSFNSIKQVAKGQFIQMDQANCLLKESFQK